MDNAVARRAIKRIASNNMRGNWLRSFLLIILTAIIQLVIFSFLPLRIPLEEELIAAGNDAMKILALYLPQTITKRTIASFVVTALLYILVSCPLSVGTCRFFLKIAKGEQAKLGDAFSVFCHLGTVFGSIWLNFLIALISVFWTFLFMLVPILVTAFAVIMDAPLLTWVIYALSIGAAIFIILWTSRYTFALYIYAEGELGAFASLCEAIHLMRSRTGECLTLRASYFLWDIVCYFIPPLSFVYSCLVNTVYAKYLEHLRGELFIKQEPPQTDM